MDMHISLHCVFTIEPNFINSLYQIMSYKKIHSTCYMAFITFFHMTVVTAYILTIVRQMTYEIWSHFGGSDFVFNIDRTDNWIC